jgi:hypothetical protein
MVGQGSCRAAPMCTSPRVATHIFLDCVWVLNTHHSLAHQHCLLLVTQCLGKGYQSQMITAPQPRTQADPI